MSADNYFITDQNGVYFLTFTVTDWIDVFSRKEYKFEIVDSLNYCIKHKGHEYLFSSARDYAGEKGLVNVQTEI